MKIPGVVDRRDRTGPYEAQEIHGPWNCEGRKVEEKLSSGHLGNCTLMMQ